MRSSGGLVRGNGEQRNDRQVVLRHSVGAEPGQRDLVDLAEGVRPADVCDGGPNGDYARITTASVAHGPWEVRIHRVEAPEGALVREGGWAIADDGAAPVAETGAGWAAARRGDGLTSALVALLGWHEPAAPCGSSVASARGHNAYGHHSATPLLTARHPGGTRVLATLVVLTSDPSLHGDMTALRTGTTARLEPDGSVQVVFPDKTSEKIRVTAAPDAGGPA
jgi:hypothetical protein